MNSYEIDIEAIIDLVNSDPLSCQIALMGSFELYLKTFFYLINSKAVTIKDFHQLVISSLENIALGRASKRNLLINILS